MPTDTRERNKQTVRRLYEDCISRGNLGLLTELVADDYVGVRGERGPSEFGNTISGLLTAFPDIHFTIEDLIAEGDRVTVRWTWEGTHEGSFRGFPASQKHLTDTGIAIYQLRDGKIVRAWLETDRLGFLQQIGAVPAGLGAGAGAPSKSQ